MLPSGRSPGNRDGMPQLQLLIFPPGVTEINHQIAVQNQGGTVPYLYGHIPVFHHAEKDVRGFRMFTSQMIVNGTVKRYVKVFRERGAEGFHVAKLRHSSASVLQAEVLERAQPLLEAGQSVPAVARELKVLGNTLHQAICAGRLRKKRAHPKTHLRLQRSKHQERAQSGRQPSPPGQRHHVFPGTSGGSHGDAGVSPDSVSIHLRRHPRRGAAGLAGRYWRLDCCATRRRCLRCPRDSMASIAFSYGWGDGAWRASALWSSCGRKPQASGAESWVSTASPKCAPCAPS